MAVIWRSFGPTGNVSAMQKVSASVSFVAANYRDEERATAEMSALYEIIRGGSAGGSGIATKASARYAGSTKEQPGAAGKRTILFRSVKVAGCAGSTAIERSAQFATEKRAVL